MTTPSRTKAAFILGACCAGIALLITCIPAGAQSTATQLDDARKRAKTIKSRAQQLAEEYADRQAALHRTENQIVSTRSDMKHAEDEMSELSNELKDRIRTAYRMRGLGFFDFLLNAKSLRDFSVRLITLQRQATEDEGLILQLRRKRAELELKEVELKSQQKVQEEQSAAVKAQARRMKISFEEARSLVNQLKGQLRAEQISSLFRVGGPSVGGMTVPFDACPAGGPHAFSNDWGAPRGGGTRRHQGNDIFAAKGSPILAPVSGTISRWGTGGNGGISIYLWGSDSNEYYFAHNSRNIAPRGSKVSAGQQIATVGNTGNARGGADHIHFEIHPNGGGAINPYPSLVRVC